MEFQKSILKSGARVVFGPISGIETVTIEILVAAGSKYETNKNNGISHFLEHMMFKGTKKRPSARAIAQTLDRVGGEYNAFTSKENTGYWVKVPAKHFNLALDVVSDLYLNPLLKSEEIEKERGVILQEMAMYKDTPMIYVWDVFENLLYGDQPAGWDIIGTEENIHRLSREDFISYLKKNYLPNHTVITIAGNFNPQKALEEVEKSFIFSKNKQKKQAKKKTIESQSRPQMRSFLKETDQTHLILGFRGPNMFNPDRYAAMVVGGILGGGMSSRMFLNIREKRGLTYYIDASADFSTDTGYFYTRAGVEHSNLEKAVQFILNEFRRLKKTKVGKKELEKTKEGMKGRLLMSLESTTSAASFFGKQELFRRKIDSPEELFQEIDKVGPEEIIDLSQRYFQKKNLNLAFVGPARKNEKLTQILSRFE